MKANFLENEILEFATTNYFYPYKLNISVQIIKISRNIIFENGVKVKLKQFRYVKKKQQIILTSNSLKKIVE